MSITMRIVQRFQASEEKKFMQLEAEFARLEKTRPDFPKGARRLQPIAAAEPCNTLIWEGQFPDLAAAQKVLDLFATDTEHDALAAQQSPLFEVIRVEFYRNLEFGDASD